MNPATLGVYWSFRLPHVANVLDRDRLSAGLREVRADVVVIDPLYLCLLAGADARGVEAGNLFHMGPLLLGVARASLDAGCTPLLCHHAADQKARMRGKEPLEWVILHSPASANLRDNGYCSICAKPSTRRRVRAQTVAVGRRLGWSGGLLGRGRGGGRPGRRLQRPEVGGDGAASGGGTADAAAAKDASRQEAKHQRVQDDGSLLLTYLDEHAPDGGAPGWTRTGATGCLGTARGWAAPSSRCLTPASSCGARSRSSPALDTAQFRRSAASQEGRRRDAIGRPGDSHQEAPPDGAPSIGREGGL